MQAMTNIDTLFHGGTNGWCPNVGPTAAPGGGPATDPSNVTPSIQGPCWTDAQGINVTTGVNLNNTTGALELMALAGTFDRNIGNIWGQTEGTEGREMMVTGLFGPQTDIDVYPNWNRGYQTTGEDPYLSAQMVASQINGMQGVGLQSEMKHMSDYNAQANGAITYAMDQQQRETLLTPYESGETYGAATATMCSYQLWQDANLPGNLLESQPRYAIRRRSDRVNPQQHDAAEPVGR